MKKTWSLISLLIIVGFMISWVGYNMITSYTDLGDIYVAKEEIAAQTKVEFSQFVLKKQPKKTIPNDAITSQEELKQLVGRLTRTIIVKEQPLQTALISEAHNLREVIQNYSVNYVAVTIPIDTTDIPVEVIHRNDVISLIGISKESQSEGGEKVLSGYKAENVLVLDTIVDQSSTSGKIIALVPREQAPDVERDIVAGKVRIVLDPRKFEMKGE